MEKLNKAMLICIIMLAFLTGFLSCYALDFVYINEESPFLIGISQLKVQPNDWIKEKDIEVFSDKVVIKVENALLGRYADTGSMLPTFGENANGIKIIPENPEQVNIGDIISFEENGKLIIHRVVAKGEDNGGDYFVTKGDNNTGTDGKVYFKDVKYVTIGVIY